MQHDNDHLIVMAGGMGKRCWPFSRKNFPKQFHDLLGRGKSLLQCTVARFEKLIKPENIWVVTHCHYADIVKQQLPFVAESQILLEPLVKNTAPCIAYACYKIAVRHPAANLVITPADHIIENIALFTETIQLALTATAEANQLVILGVACTKPEIGYGYIEFVQPETKVIKKVSRFVEKPTQEKAETYFAQENYAWNTGIFVGNVTTFIKSYQQYLPDMNEAFEKGKQHLHTAKEPSFIEEAYQRLPNLSFDQGVLEKATNIYGIVGEWGWSDIGTWRALYEYSTKDKEANVIQGNVVAVDTKQCMIKNTANTLIATYRVKDLIIAQHDKVIMICPQGQEQKVKTLVDHVTARKGKDYV
ncbi:MAG: mannose-1-phosphate guanylyltransferase [Cytophagales bacterium]|nr:mannose-1-phosphate guanylyltransferase [Cytophagales bacterium]